MLLPLYLLWLVSAAFSVRVYVGQIFAWPVIGVDIYCHPPWIELMPGYVRGIPGENDIGLHRFLFGTEKRFTKSELVINVIQEETGPCYPEATYWMEAHYEEKPSMNELFENIQIFADNYNQTNLKIFRSYSQTYGKKIRSLESYKQYEPVGRHMLMWPIGCGDGSEGFDDAISTMAELIQVDLPIYSYFLAHGEFKEYKRRVEKHHLRMICSPDENSWSKKLRAVNLYGYATSPNYDKRHTQFPNAL